MVSRVLVLGGTGMLGSTVVAVLRSMGVPVTATTRDAETVPARLRDSFTKFDAVTDDAATLLRDLGPSDYLVNCIGIIKHHLDDQKASDRQSAIAINAQFPYFLAKLAQERGFHVVQIATDCVYAGTIGSYDELAAHDATDVYGKSKSLGEVPSANFLNLRCSIIGPEQKNKGSLLEWVLSHRPGTSFNGYTDHFWNGVTTDVFAQLVAGIVRNNLTLSGVLHMVPADRVNKDELSRLILEAYGRQDVAVVPVETGNGVDRTLATLKTDDNSLLWSLAGYESPPTIASMVRNLASTTRFEMEDVND